MPSAYAVKKEKERQRNARNSREDRDIAPLPKVKNPRRKKGARSNFGAFCRSYFPLTFSLEWSDDHLKVIRQIEESVLHGGLFATAMPRGSGKTSLAEVGCIWAVLYGHRDFVCLIGSDEGRAAQMLDSIKTEMETNEALLQDFPEAVYPIHELEGIAHRCNGQLFKGDRTHIGWTAKELVMPTIPGSKASGAVVKVAGITGGIRGMKFKRPDGKTVRPSLVIIDDPQTDESARSPSQCETRERILAGAVLGLAGPGKKISGIMPCTVISPGDMADNILDRGKHPDWNGTRTKMVYAFPKNEALWEQYKLIRAEGLRGGDGGREATEFYGRNRAAMDEGAVVAWPARFNHDELSAVQHAMNLKLRDERAFHAEYQNEPLPEQEARTDVMTPDQVTARVNNLRQGVVPVSASHLTVFIDVHGSLLYYAVAAWEDDFTGHIVDYGTFPDQKRPYFALREAKITIADKIAAPDAEGQLYGALEALTEAMLGREWAREDDTTLRIERCLIDANWGTMTDLVYRFCRRSTFAGIITPSHGRGIRASMKPMREYSKKPGDRVGFNWRIDASPGKRAIRKALFDANAWKSFLHARLSTPIGSRSCLSLYGSKPDAHRLLADHLTSEYPVATTAMGRTVDEWFLKPNCDNHYLDAVVGCCVAASIQGVTLAEAKDDAARSTRRKKYGAAYFQQSVRPA